MNLTRREAFGLRPSLVSVGVLATSAAVATVSWSAVRLSTSVTLSDAFLVAAALALGSAVLAGRLSSVGTIRRRVLGGAPLWLLASGAILLISGVLAALGSNDFRGNLAPAVAFVVALTFVPIIVGLATTGTSRTIRLFSLFLVASSAISGAVAVTDLVTGNGVSTSLNGALFLGRSAGLSVHPNHLSLAAAMALPFVYALLVTSTRRAEKAFVGILLVLAVGAIFASGSRAGVACALGGVATVWFLARGEFRQWRVALGMLAISILALIVSSVVGWHQLSVATDRISGAQSVGASDTLRLEDISQAVSTISSNPLLGAGFSTVRIAHNIYLQLAEAGGLLAVTAFGIFAFGSVGQGVQLSRAATLPIRVQPFAAAAVASLLAWFAAGMVENQVYDRWLYVPCGLLVGMLLVARQAGGEASGSVRRAEWTADPRIEGRLVGGELAVDLGCGGGEWADAASRRYGRVVGIDISTERLQRRTHPRGDWEFVQADLNQGIPLPDGCADAVHADQVIEHVANPLYFVIEAHRVLRPGGVLVLATPNVRYLRHLIRLVIGGHGPITSGGALRTPEVWDEGHIHFLTSRDLEWLAQTAGFSRIDTEALINTTGSLGLLRRVLNHARRRGLVKGLLTGNLMLAATK